MSGAEQARLDPLGAFIERFEVEGASDGPLAGLTVAVKDLFDVAGHATRFGSPAWAESHAAPATATAPAVAALLAAGARLVGKTHMDELAWSLSGVNAHYGAPQNPAAPDRAAGGSSSGSASATAGGLADIGLGSDTGGSVRAPASFCGLYGMRPSHGRISLDAARPLAASFDTAGWFARDAETFLKVGAAYGLADPAAPVPAELVLPVDLWAEADPATLDALAPALRALEALYGPARPVRLSAEGLGQWREVFRVVQASEIWAEHGAWVRAARPSFGPGVAERFTSAEALSAAEIEAARAARRRIAGSLHDFFAGGALAVFPTAPSPGPRLDADAASVDAFRARALAMLSAAGIGGLPQASLPAALVSGAPVGLSLMAAQGADAMVLNAAAALNPAPGAPPAIA